MASAQSPNPYTYSQAEQLKHYNLYMVITPAMFCIILAMLLYLFYLKNHTFVSSHPPPTFTRAPSFSSFVIPIGDFGGHIIQRPSLDENGMNHQSRPSLDENATYHPFSRRRHVVFEVGLKEDLKEKLPTIVFDEELKARDSSCCVCLGEFEMKEELIQLPSCKHIFHPDCICHWLSSSTTCPLCRCSDLVDNTNIVPPQPPQSSSPAVLPRAFQIEA